MSFTPAFQKMYDELQAGIDAGWSGERIESFFQESCKALGPYERLNNLYRVRPKTAAPGSTERVVFFRFNPMQEKYWANKTHRDLALKMRQGGFTTLKCIQAFDKAIWEQGTRSAIMADTSAHVKEYFGITKLALKWFQKDWGAFYKVTSPVDNVTKLEIAETGSHLLVCTNARGLTLDFLHIAEAAFIDDQEISDSMEAVPLSGEITLETTADTASGLFYELWDRALKDSQVLFTGHFFEWWVRYPEPEDIKYLKVAPDFKPTADESALMHEHGLNNNHLIWRRLKISECKGDVGEFLRKYPEDPMTCFLSGASSVFPPDVLAALWKNEKAPAFVGDLVME